MADLSKFKRKNSLGAPPPMTEASTNLEAPETAPVAPPPTAEPKRKASPTSQHEPEAPPRVAEKGKGVRIETGHAEGRPDGRSARKTGRTIQFATRVSPEFDDRLRQIADREGRLLVEVLERALDAYETPSRTK